jgi:hypothetical protein
MNLAARYTTETVMLPSNAACAAEKWVKPEVDPPIFTTRAAARHTSKK